MSGSVAWYTALLAASLPSTSYANTGGTGARTGIITVTQDSTNTIGVGYTISKFVDGSFTNSIAGSVGFAGNFTVDATHWIRFDFGSTKYITEAKWYQSTTDAHGSWKWQGSNDGSTFTDIGASFTLGAATTQTQTTLSSNAGLWRYYRLIGVSGTANNAPFIQEIEFKISA